MSNTLGKALTLTLFGESHGASVGCVVDGIAAGIKVDEAFIASQMDKRRAKGLISTQRHEGDIVLIQSGVVNGYTTGTPLCLIIQNTNTKSGDYSKTQGLLRPGHADFTAHIKYKGFEDARGGGHFSGRLTAPIVAAASIFVDLFKSKNVHIATHLLKCAGVEDASFSAEFEILAKQINQLNISDFAVLDTEAGEVMQEKIENAAKEGDSVGGVLETIITGLPVGLGEPFFNSVESALAHALFSIPAVKGVEFGIGFRFADKKGSEANDFFITDGKNIFTKTNNNGGINGGITNGMPIIVRTVIKPTPSIYKQQQTVNIDTMTNETLQLHGRHDPCILHRARVVQDSLCALVLADLATQVYGVTWQEAKPWITG
ncbi:MAG: chorismate synthase [Clostridiales bacterium]|nr:MAG: chorismate synthase [Clostridiales bacterium]